MQFSVFFFFFSRFWFGCSSCIVTSPPCGAQYAMRPTWFADERIHAHQPYQTLRTHLITCNSAWHRLSSAWLVGVAVRRHCHCNFLFDTLYDGENKLDIIIVRIEMIYKLKGSTMRLELTGARVELVNWWGEGIRIISFRLIRNIDFETDRFGVNFADAIRLFFPISNRTEMKTNANSEKSHISINTYFDFRSFHYYLLRHSSNG